MPSTDKFTETILEAIPLPVFFKDHEGVYRMCNDAFACQIIGLPKEKIIGETVLTLDESIPPDLADFYHRKDLELIERGGVQDYEAEVSLPTGERRHFAFHKTVIRDQENRLLGLIGIMRDINEETQLQVQLQETATAMGERIKELRGLYKLHDALDISVPIQVALQAVVDLIPDSFQYPDDTFARIQLENGTTVTSKDFSESEWHLQADLFCSDKKKCGQLTIYCREKYLEEHQVPFLLEECDLVQGFARHISEFLEQAKVREDLMKKSGHLDAIAASSQDAIVMMDPEGAIAFWNAAAEKIFGHDRTAAIGQSLHELLAPERFHTAFRQGFAKFQQTGEGPVVGKTVELTGRRKSGEEFPMELSLSKIFQDGAWHAVGIIRDITVRKQALADREAAFTELEQTLKKLQETQSVLIEAEKLKSVGHLAAGIAHEVKNPLSILRMGLEYLNSSGTDQPVAADVLKDMQDAIDRADTVIMGLLDYARTRKPEKENTDLPALIHRALDILRYDLEKHKISVAVKIDDNLPTISVDQQKMLQVFINILTNAIQAIGSSGTIEVRARHDTDQGRLSIRIHDSGPGFAPEVLNKVFEPFFTTKSRHLSTGLGMGVVQSIVEMHQGRIEINNAAEGGAIVTIELPV